MDVTVDVWQLAGVLGGVSSAGAGVVWALVRVIVGQHTRAIEGRLAGQDKAREAATRHWDEQFRRIEDTARANERELLTLRAELPREYQRREDAIRSESIIMAKLDVLAMKLDRVHGGQP